LSEIVNIRIFVRQAMRSIFHWSINDIRKVSSGYKYSLLIFALRFGLILKVVGLDAELNFLTLGQAMHLSTKFYYKVLKIHWGDNYRPVTIQFNKFRWFVIMNQSRKQYWSKQAYEAGPASKPSCIILHFPDRLTVNLIAWLVKCAF